MLRCVFLADVIVFVCEQDHPAFDLSCLSEDIRHDSIRMVLLGNISYYSGIGLLWCTSSAQINCWVVKWYCRVTRWSTATESPRVGLTHQSLFASLFTSVTCVSKRQRCWIEPLVESYLWTPGLVLLRPLSCDCSTFRWLLLCFPISLLIRIYVIEQRKSLHDTKLPFCLVLLLPVCSDCCSRWVSYPPVSGDVFVWFNGFREKWEVNTLPYNLTSTAIPLVLLQIEAILIKFKQSPIAICIFLKCCNVILIKSHPARFDENYAFVLFIYFFFYVCLKSRMVVLFFCLIGI